MDRQRSQRRLRMALCSEIAWSSSIQNSEFWTGSFPTTFQISITRTTMLARPARCSYPAPICWSEAGKRASSSSSTKIRWAILFRPRITMPRFCNGSTSFPRRTLMIPTQWHSRKRTTSKAVQFKNNRFATTPIAPKPVPPNKGKSFPGGFLGTTASKAANVPVPDWIAMPGGAISLSANGAKAGTGIVWASHPHGLVPNSNVDANQHVVKGIMRAYNAENLTKELWNSEMNPRDSIGNFAKFNPPTVANGKAYLASFGSVPIPSGGDARKLQPQDIQKIQASYHFSVYGLR